MLEVKEFQILFEQMPYTDAIRLIKLNYFFKEHVPLGYLSFIVGRTDFFFLEHLNQNHREFSIDKVSLVVKIASVHHPYHAIHYRFQYLDYRYRYL